jgi:hypothetical protein
MRRAIRPAQTGRKATIMSAKIQAFISFNPAPNHDAEEDLIVLVSDRHSARNVERMCHKLADSERRNFYMHVQFDGDATAARAAVVAHAAERRAQLARLYA